MLRYGLTQQDEARKETATNWYLEVLKKYTVFSGRARRKEYWLFVLFNGIFTIVASILDTVLFGTAIGGLGPLYGLYALAVLVPSLAVLR